MTYVVKDEKKFIETELAREFSFKPYQHILENAYKSNNPWHYLHFDQKELNYFTFPLPEIDLDKVRKESAEIIKREQDNIKYSVVPGHPNFKKWQIFFLYKSKTTKERNNYKHDFAEDDFEFIYDDEYPEIKKMITMYNNKSNPSWLSVLLPGGEIPAHRDNVSGDRQLSKSRIPIFWPKDCFCLLENVGKLDYYSDEMVMFNHRQTHGVYNYSDSNKVCLSVSNQPQTDEVWEIFILAIKNKIEKILNEF